ncbi:MAG: hypothetical protein OEL78_05285 [Hyphomicrobiales bacterium]|nr:hypothetical protein [Hyphomicrobiales bacterium]
MTPPTTAKTTTAGPAGGLPAGEVPANGRYGKGRLVTAPVAIGLAVWAGLAFLLAEAGLFQTLIGGIPVAMVAAIALPVLGFLLAWRMFPRCAALSRRRTWRCSRHCRAGALPAGLGDVAVGLIAPFAAIAVALQAPGWRRAANAVIVAGLADFADFAVAIATGIGSIDGNFLNFAGAPSNAIINALPLVLIPSFLVPVFAILHTMAIIKLRSMR